MAEEDKELKEREETMGLVALTARALEDYFSLLKSDVSENDISKEFQLDPSKKPENLSSMLKDFTNCFLKTTELGSWSNIVYLGTMKASDKYALRTIGKVKDKKYGNSEDERGFNYIKKYLGYIKIARKGEKKQKEIACSNLINFFDKLATLAEQEVEWL